MMGRRGRSRMKRRGLSRLISSNAIQKNEGLPFLRLIFFYVKLGTKIVKARRRRNEKLN
jgi:hypothetical protein